MKTRILIGIIGLLSVSLLAFNYINQGQTNKGLCLPVAEKSGCMSKVEKTTCVKPEEKKAACIKPEAKAKCKAPEEKIELKASFELPGLIKNDWNIYYAVKPRFNNTMTKERLKSAKTVYDLIPNHGFKKVDMFKSVQVVHLKKSGDIGALGVEENFTEEQKAILNSLNYSDDFLLKADYQNLDVLNGKMDNNYFAYYMTVVPEIQASYESGNASLVNYLKTKTNHYKSFIKQEDLRPGKVSFVVNESGQITNAKLTDTCGDKQIDQDLVELIKSIPGKWNPADDGKGNKVSQELIFYFGKEGC